MIGTGFRTEFRTEDVPRDERFEYWWQLMGRTRASDILSEHAADFWAEQRRLELGPVTVWSASFLPSRYRRSPRMVRRADPEMFHLSLLREGRLALDHAGRSDSFAPGDMHMMDSSRPYDLWSADGQEGRVVRGLAVDFPKALLPLPPRRVDELLGRAMPGREGAGALLTDFLSSLDRLAGTLRPADAPRLGSVVLDLLSVWSAEALEAREALPHESRQRVIAVSVRAFIRQNLHDPELTPSVIAAAHHISVSYLHRIFQRESPGETVAAHIRIQRLRGAYKDLADPALRATPVHAVAARWGFARAAEFTRAFRAAYGLSPREHRLLALAERIRADERMQQIHGYG
ncbi:helix-turn-helix domain-containing protein [Streptomyces sp. NPDC093085]|uniref:AraC-like ligand-binding domain-containing protein n=1 Tax=Streptomyces sp. NPDC093085 TaxID=3155068 RepID=UPI0034405CD2